MYSSCDPTRATFRNSLPNHIIERRCVDTVKTSWKSVISCGRSNRKLIRDLFLRFIPRKNNDDLIRRRSVRADTRNYVPQAPRCAPRRLHAGCYGSRNPIHPPGPSWGTRFFGNAQLNRTLCTRSLFRIARLVKLIARRTYGGLAALFTIFTEGKWENNNNDCARRRGKKRRWIKYCF